MNVLFLSLLYPRDQMEEIRQNARDKIQNQIDVYQHAYLSGIRLSLAPEEKLSVLNGLPVGIFPLQYRKLLLKDGLHEGGTVRNLFTLNVPVLKQFTRRMSCQRALRRWLKASPDNRKVLLYTQYLPYMRAIRRARKSFPDLKAAVIVTDLPNEYGLSTGRRGILKAMERRMGERSLELMGEMDGFVLLTEPMAEVIPVGEKPTLVMEGLCLHTAGEAEEITLPEEESAVLYTGTLEEELGILSMLEAFSAMPQYQLWICGTGSMKDTARRFADEYPNIHYFGLVSREEAVSMQRRAAALINPRPATGLFTRYSFPSKTMEYLASGRPVLCCRLAGIPREYDAYLNDLGDGSPRAIQSAVTALLQKSPEERHAMGARGRAFVLTQKNERVQGQRLVEFLRGL